MSKEIPLDVLLEHAGSDYEDLPADVKAMVDEAEADLARVGVDVDADLAASEGAEAAPTSVTVARDKTAPQSFTSRGAARKYANTHGLKVVDNGADAADRWTVAPKAAVAAASSGATSTRKSTKRKATATAATTPAASARAQGKKEIAIEVYRELETAGTLKRSTFLAEMDRRVGLSAKGASSYFYRIKGGKW